jgi:peptidoglycan/LPS O-acetylase OafA/YrhL
MNVAPKQFRQDINGLRGLAVIAVVLYHFGAAGFGGGFIGVDVFFVISGYLMSQIVLSRVQTQSFRVVDFYAARARRIVPALVFLTACGLVLGWFFISPYEFRALGKHSAATVLFLSNFVFLSETGYFNPLSDEKWLLHTWSLSVEWQFYLLLPLLIVLLNKLGGIRAITSGVWAFLIGSFALSVVLTYTVPDAAFYMLPTRAWELLLGSVVFLRGQRPASMGSEIIGWGGLALIGGCIALYSKNTPYPGYFAAVPTLGAAMIIGTGFVGPLLRTKPLQWLGDVSYSLYLWHWPIFVAERTFDQAGTVRLVALAATFPIAYASYRLIEVPFRSLRVKTPWRTLIGYSSVVGRGFLRGARQVGSARSRGHAEIYHRVRLFHPYEKGGVPLAARAGILRLESEVLQHRGWLGVLSPLGGFSRGPPVSRSQCVGRSCPTDCECLSTSSRFQLDIPAALSRLQSKSDGMGSQSPSFDRRSGSRLVELPSAKRAAIRNRRDHEGLERKRRDQRGARRSRSQLERRVAAPVVQGALSKGCRRRLYADGLDGRWPQA